MVPAKTWTRIASRLSLVAYTSVIPVYRLDVSLEYTLDEKKGFPFSTGSFAAGGGR